MRASPSALRSSPVGIFYQAWNATYATFFQEMFPTRTRVTHLPKHQPLHRRVPAGRLRDRGPARVKPRSAHHRRHLLRHHDHRRHRRLVGPGDLPRPPQRSRQPRRRPCASRRVRADPRRSLRTDQRNGRNTPWQTSGLQSARSLPHLSTLVRLADKAGALEEPELAAHRWNAYLALHGVETTTRVFA
jgi:Protein of unknown function (DUF993)